MAYRKKGRKFGRERDIRNHFMRSLARSLVLHGRIQTTEARAKALRPFVEKLVTKAGDGTLPTRRLLSSRLRNDDGLVKKLMEDLGPKYRDRSGGYTRITKVEPRPGSTRTVAVIEFV